MPELPEVETIARGLDKRIAGDVIESVWLGEKPQPLKSSAAEIAVGAGALSYRPCPAHRQSILSSIWKRKGRKGQES